MCNLSEGILEDGMGIATCKAIRKLLNIMSPDEIIKVMDYNDGFVNDVVSLIQKYPNASDREIFYMVEFE